MAGTRGDRQQLQMRFRRRFPVEKQVCIDRLRHCVSFGDVRSSRSSRRPSWPPPTVTTAKPDLCRCRSTSSCTVASSSTARINRS